ncbi:MAG TPA: PAS domain S-box protein [Blastocatellia bacterium]|nr:PAS domain S-box protein [Blastocatellia bacterium]
MSQSHSFNLKKQLTISLVLPMILLTTLGGILAWQIDHLLSVTDWVAHTNQVIVQTTKLGDFLDDGELGLRGYLLTGDPDFLEPYDTSRPAVDSGFNDLKQLISDNSPQLERLQAIRSTYAQWQEFAAEVIARKRDGKEYMSLLNMRVDRQLFRTMSDEIDTLTETERQLRQQRLLTVQRSTRQTIATALSVIVLVGCLLGVWIRRQLVAVSRRFEDTLAVADRKTKALIESEDRYRDLVENSRDLICTHDLKGRLLSVNRAAANLLGYEPGELLDRSLGDLLAPEAGEEFDRYLSLIDRDGAASGLMVVQTRLGERRVWEYNNNLRSDGVASPVVRGMAHDITERTQTEAKLRKSEKQLAEAQQLAHVGSWEHHVTTDEVIWSDELFRIFGFEPGEIQPTYATFLELIPEEGREKLQQMTAAAMAERTPFALHHRVIRRDGEQRILYASGRAVFNEAGDFVRMVGTAQDVTEQRRAEEALLESEQRYRSLVELSPEAIAVHCEGKFVYMNSAGLNMFGAASPDEIIGKPVLGTVHPDYQEIVLARIRQNGEGKQSGLMQQRLIRLDGKPIEAEVTGIPTMYQSKPAVQIVIRDITEQRRLEEQLRQSQKMQAIGQLAGGVAHDFNNLLTVITGYSQMAIEGAGANDELRGDIGEIQKASERAAALTRQLLAFSRQQVLQLKVLNLNTVIADTEKMLRRLIGEHIQLITKLSPDLAQLKADPGQVEQVIMNLAVNARDAMPEGGKLIIETANVDLDDRYVREHVGARTGPHVMLAVTDTGTGMDKATMSRIFEPFFTTKEIGKGTGLGLSTVFGIVKQSGGNIWVYSEPGSGTTFKIYLPSLHAADDSSPAKADKLLPRGSETVLLVEDEAALRVLAARALRKQGYNVLEASNGEEALQVAQGRAGMPLDVVVTDVIMPQMGGKPLALLVQGMRPDTKVLFMSGYTNDAILHQGVLEEGAAFLQKPFTPDALVRKIHEVLNAA